MRLHTDERSLLLSLINLTMEFKRKADERDVKVMTLTEIHKEMEWIYEEFKFNGDPKLKDRYVELQKERLTRYE